ncbi:MAG: hypothetical protein U0736_09465 [Gemmataceae bacterium]
MLAALGVIAGVAALCLPLAAQPNERYIKDDNPVTDTDVSRGGKLWVLDFKFKDPRLIKVNIPGRGQRVCWYLWYQVINRTGQPRTFIPDFELVTHDTTMVYRDQILPAVQEAIARVEDPTGFYKIKNSVTIAAEPIPVSLPMAAPIPVTGVAIWTDPNEPEADDDVATRERKEKLPKLIDSNRYSIFVAGLSNGWSLTDPIPPSTKPVVRRKTLQLSFRRLGDKYLMKSEAIQFIPPAQWIYRASQLDLASGDKGKAKEADKPKAAEKPKAN